MYEYMDGLSATPDDCRSTRVTKKDLLHNMKDDQWKIQPEDWDRDFVECKVIHLLDGYDFVGLVERQDESLVAMKMLFKLKFRDI